MKMAEERTYEVMRDLKGYLTQEQIKSIYNAAESVRDKALIRLLWKSGRRIGEILAVQIKDIDFVSPAIVWHIEKKTKREHGKRVKLDLRKRKPLDNFTFRLLRYYVQEEELKYEHYLFSSQGDNSKHLSRQRAFQIVRRLGELAGIDKVGEKGLHPHHFRHSFAVDVARKLKSPADMEKLRRWMEHGNLGITQTYLQFGDDELNEVISEDTD